MVSAMFLIVDRTLTTMAKTGFVEMTRTHMSSINKTGYGYILFTMLLNVYDGLEGLQPFSRKRRQHLIDH